MTETRSSGKKGERGVFSLLTPFFFSYPNREVVAPSAQGCRFGYPWEKKKMNPATPTRLRRLLRRKCRPRCG